MDPWLLLAKGQDSETMLFLEFMRLEYDSTNQKSRSSNSTNRLPFVPTGIYAMQYTARSSTLQVHCYLTHHTNFNTHDILSLLQQRPQEAINIKSMW